MRKTKLFLMAFLNSGEIRSKKQGDMEMKKMWAVCQFYFLY